MEPNVEVAAPVQTIGKPKYLKNKEYRSARSRIRWAVGLTYFFAVANLALGILFFSLNSQGTPSNGLNLPVAGTLAIIQGVLMVVLGYFIARRSRVAAGIGIAFGVVALALALYYGLALGTLPAIGVPAGYLYIMVTAFRAIPTVLGFERG